MTRTPASGTPAHRTNLHRTERGASELFMLILVVTMLAFAGLAYDAGMAFNARRVATNTASAAARAGAQEVDENFLYTTGFPILESSATSVARNWAQAEGMRVLEVDIDHQVEVFIRVEAVHETTFLRVIGIGSLTVEGEARARAQNRARS